MRIRPKTLLLLVSPVLLLVAAAFIHWGVAGLPPLTSTPALTPVPAAGPAGFPAWLRIAHYVNFLFLILLIRSGLQILMDHPRLYGNLHCTPGTEWLRLTPVEVPRDRVWTAKDDSRHLSPWIGLPGYRHTVGMARHWHFLSVLFWVGNGFVFVALLFWTGQWKRLVPTSWRILPEAWAVFVHYATFHLPPEPNGFFRYNALQQLAYFAVIFVLAPLAILTGPSMSPALTNRFRWYPFLPGNRQIGRSIHFLVMFAFVVFLVGHVAMITMTGLIRNMNHIVRGTDDASPAGLYLGLVGIAVILPSNALANWAAWRRPREDHVGNQVQGVHGASFERRTSISDPERQDSASGDAQGLGSSQVTRRGRAQETPEPSCAEGLKSWPSPTNVTSVTRSHGAKSRSAANRDATALKELVNGCPRSARHPAARDSEPFRRPRRANRA
jgi:thiosulfate reductase cytochrome b subunit